MGRSRRLTPRGNEGAESEAQGSGEQRLVSNGVGLSRYVGSRQRRSSRRGGERGHEDDAPATQHQETEEQAMAGKHAHVEMKEVVERPWCACCRPRPPILL